MKETRKQKIARQAKERDRLAGKAADRTFDRIRLAMDRGDLTIKPGDGLIRLSMSAGLENEVRDLIDKARIAIEELEAATTIPADVVAAGVAYLTGYRDGLKVVLERAV
jgi:hypothetical protein